MLSFHKVSPSSRISNVQIINCCTTTMVGEINNVHIIKDEHFLNGSICVIKRYTNYLIHENNCLRTVICFHKKGSIADLSQGPYHASAMII